MLKGSYSADQSTVLKCEVAPDPFSNRNGPVQTDSIRRKG